MREQIGNAARTDIHFPDTDIVIVKAGETISKPTIANVQKVVKSRLEELENEIKEQRQREMDHFKMDSETLRASADLDMEQLRNTLDDQSSAVRDENTRLRDELLELRPSHFYG